MFGILDGLCGCFSPDLKRNIIQYLSSAKLNRQLIEEQKTNEQSQQAEESIYSQVKTKSYYFMKLQQEENEQKQSPEDELMQNEHQPNYYPQDSTTSIDEIYHIKFTILRKLLGQEIGMQYSKIYDSQDDNALKIYCKSEIYQNKRFNSYRFSFKIPHKDHPLSPKDYLELQPEQVKLHEPLLTLKQKMSTTDKGVEVFHRKYKKILVINQHDFYTAEHAQTVTQNNDEVIYNTVFSVKGEWEKLSDYSRGWINLVGMRVSSSKPQEQDSNSLHQEEGYLLFEGYINVELEISVNSNMLKQPIAKEIRVYVQKLICTLIKSDAI